MKPAPDSHPSRGTVQVTGITKCYLQGKIEIRALDDVTLSFARGEFTALVGPSGSGKTTLLNLIGGLDTPDSGRVDLAGRRLDRLSPAEATRIRLEEIGFVFQAYNLIPVLSALENVEYIMLLQGVDRAGRRERAARILDEVGLAGLHHRRPADMSGGQQQRVAVARDFKTGDDMIFVDLSRDEGGLQCLAVVRRDPETGSIASDQASLAVHYQAFLGSGEVFALAAWHYDQPVIGAGASGLLGQAGWRIDATWNRIQSDFGPNSSDAFALVANLHYSWIWGGRNLYGFLEYYHNPSLL